MRFISSFLILLFLFSFVGSVSAQTPTPMVTAVPNITSPSSVPSGNGDIVVRIPIIWNAAFGLVFIAWGVLLIYAGWRLIAGLSGL